MNVIKADQGIPSGFSLLELLLVVALIGLLAAFATPALFKILTNMHLKTAAQKTVAVIRYAHSQAVSKSKPLWIVFDREENVIVLLNQPLEIKKTKNTAREAPGIMSASLKVYPYPENVTIEKLIVEGEEIFDSKGAFIFYPNGSCNGGEIFLRANTSRVYGIILNPITGMARIASHE